MQQITQKHSDFKYLLSQFLWVKDVSMAWQGPVLQGFHRLQSRCLLQLQSHQKAQLGRIHFQVTAHVFVGKIQFLEDYCLEASLSSLPPGTLHRAPHSMVTGKQRRKKKCQQESGSKMKVQSLIINLVTEVASNHCCHILLISSELQGPASSRVGHGVHRSQGTS